MQKTVLIIEESLAQAVACAAMVQNLGYAVIRSGSCRDGVRAATGDTRVDLILMDADDTGDLPCTEASAQILSHHPLPIIFRTSHADRQTAGKIRGTARYGWLLKSADEFMLQSAIELAFTMFDEHAHLRNELIACRDTVAQLENRDVVHTAMISNNSDVIAVMDKNGIFTYKSPNIERLFGWKPVELIGTDGWGTVHADDVQRVQQELFSLLQQDKATRSSEFRYKCKDGSYRMIEMTAVNLINDPRINGILLNYHDISERKHAEAMFQESEHRFRMLYENSPIGLFRTTYDGKVILANSAFVKMLGYTSFEELASKNFETVGADASYIRKNFIEQIEAHGDIKDFESTWTRRDGTVIDICESARAIRDENGKTLFYDGIIENITERKQAELTLKRNEELFRRVSDLTTDYIFKSTITEDGKTELDVVLGAFKEITGYTFEEFKTPGHWRSIVHPDDREQDDRDFQKLKNNEKVVSDIRTIRKDGQVDWMRVFAHPIWDEQTNRLAGITGAVRNITERKLVEEELQKSEKKYHELFSLMRLMSDTMPDMMWAKDLNQNYIFANQAYCEKFLSAVDTSEPIGKGDLFFANRERESHSEDPTWHTFGELCMDTDAITLREMKQMQFDEYGNIKGKFLFLDVHKAPLINDSGELIGVVGTGRDITERKQTETALKESEERQRIILESLPVAIYSSPTDPNYATSWISAGVKKITGFEAEEYLSKTDFWRNRLHPEDRDLVLHAFAQLPTTKETMLEYRWKCKDGAYHWFQDRTVFLESRSRNEYLGMIYDITERKQAEKKLLESEITYRGIINSINEAVYVLNSDGQFLDVNIGAEKTYGYERNSFIGKTPVFLAAPEKNDFDKINESLRRAYDGETQAFEFWAAASNGRIFQKEVHLYPGVYFGNKCIIAVGQDISERKLTEQLLRDMQRRESIGVMSGGIAHDFNNLLGSMMGNISLAQVHIPPDHPSASNIEKALSAMDRATRLTQQLLAYSGKGKFQTRKIDVVEMINEHVSLFNLSLPKKVSLVTHLPGASVYVDGDPGQFEQIFMNLIINGGEAIGNRQGVVSITLTQAAMTAEKLLPFCGIANTQLTKGNYALFEVTDNGSGMSAETLNRIFDPFFTTKFTGRGLGLSAVLGIIQGHKGGITVESTVGKGTTFRLILPVIDSPALPAEPVNSELAPQASAKGTILIIDDEPEVAMMAQEMLDIGKFKTLVALKPKKGIDLYRRHQSDIALVLLDLTMPEMSGEEVVVALRGIEPDVKIIITSGYSEEEVLKKIGSTPVSAFIQKPYRLKSLLDVVQKAVAP